MAKYVLAAFADEAARDLNEQIRICKLNHIHHIEMRGVNGKNISSITPEFAKEIKKTLDDNGMFVSSAGSPFGKIGICDSFAEHLESFKKTLEISNILGTKYMRMFSFYPPKGEDFNNYTDQVLERLRTFANVARGSGVMLCNENEVGVFCDRAERSLIVSKEIKEIRNIFDPANYIHAGQEILPAYELLKDYIEYFHMKDAKKFEDGKIRVVPCGEGIGKIMEILNMHNSYSQEFYLSIEPHLEVNDHSNNSAQKYVYPSSEVSFNTACTYLKSVLSASGFELKKNIDGGHGTWIK